MLFFRVQSRERSAEIADKYCDRGFSAEIFDEGNYQDIFLYPEN